MFQDLFFIFLQINNWFALFLGVLGLVIFVGWIVLNLIGAVLIKLDRKEQNARTTYS